MDVLCDLSFERNFIFEFLLAPDVLGEFQCSLAAVEIAVRV